MKKIISCLVILLLLISLVINFIFLYKYNNIRIDTENIRSIIIVNGTTFTAKAITKKQDIIKISNEINSTNMHKVKDYPSYAGGQSYIFIINNEIYISYLVQSKVLVNNGEAYKIDNTKLGEFWDLDYQQKKFRFSAFDYNRPSE